MTKKFNTVTVADMERLLQDEATLLLDCRQLHDYRSEHMDNAMHVHDDLVETLIKKGDKERPLVIYCYHGHTSEHLAELFANFGFSNVNSLAGGFNEWKEARSRQ